MTLRPLVSILYMLFIAFVLDFSINGPFVVCGILVCLLQ